MAKKEVTLSDQQLRALIERARLNVDEIARKKSLLQQGLIEVNTAEFTLKGFQGKEGKQPFLVFVGGGLYLEAELTNIKKVKELLAGSILLDKNIDQTIKALGARKTNVERELKELTEEEAKARQSLQMLLRMLTAGRKSLRKKIEKAKEEKKKAKK